jgi:glycosyltransferase involved in cell wall biosynthesis
LHVGLNLLHLVPRETGGSELYARRLVGALVDTAPGVRLTLFASREGAPSLRAEPWAPAVTIVEIPVAARRRTLRVLAEQTLLPAAVGRAHVDLLHNLFNTAPALPGVAQVTSILDVIFKRVPEASTPLLSRGLALLVPLAARRSRRVITISEASKRDIVRFLGVSDDRIDVTLLGPGMPDGVKPIPEEELRRQFGLGGAILLTVSAKRPHKNLERLFEAVARLDGPDAPVLVVPGYETVFEERLRRRAAAVAGERIRFAGWVDDATLEGLYAAASGFVFPSLAEGFGLPVLDALRRGIPVATSNATSLPEVGGDAVVYFDPLQTDELEQALRRLLGDSALRKRLAKAGPRQAEKFTWTATAEATLASYERALAAV